MRQKRVCVRPCILLASPIVSSLKHPQLVVWFRLKLLPYTTAVLPQSHSHSHRVCLWTFLSDTFITVSLQYFSPVRSMRFIYSHCIMPIIRCKEERQQLCRPLSFGFAS